MTDQPTPTAAAICPGGPATVYDLEAGTAKCPGCDNYFHTITNNPVFPPHEISPDGEFITFRPDTERVPFQWAWQQQQLHGIEPP